MNLELISTRIQESINVKKTILGNQELLNIIGDIAEEVASAICKDKKIVICGNGGSASDALHFAGEIVGRFQREREAWPAVVLNSDVATITAIANDYGYDEVFARQVQGHCKKGDVFFGISTSGNSENVYRAVIKAKEKGCKTVALLGKDGGKILNLADYSVVVPSMVTARIQECHILIIHIICELVENLLG